MAKAVVPTTAGSRQGPGVALTAAHLGLKWQTKVHTPWPWCIQDYPPSIVLSGLSSHDGCSSSAPVHSSTVTDRFTPSYVGALVLFGLSTRRLAARWLQLHAGSHDWLPSPRPPQTHAGPRHLTGSQSARSSTPALGFGGFRIYCCLACIAARMIPAEASSCSSQLPAPRQIPSWLAVLCQLAAPSAGAVCSPAAPAVSRLHAGLQFHADLQLYTLSIMLVGGTTLVSSSTLARRSLPAR